VPSRIYKYEPYSAQTLKNLKGQVLYFGSPLGFNDPYDCALTPGFVLPTEDDIEAIRAHYLNKPDLPASVRDELNHFSYRQLSHYFLRAGFAAIDSAVAGFAKQRGVTCFSERNDDLLMWSHYGGRYRGLCLEFDTTSEGFQKLQPVRYVDRPPPLSLRKMLVEGDYDAVADLFCTKAAAWAYEREWRAMHAVAGTEYVYPALALTGIFFGPDIDEQSLEIVCLILKGQNSGVKLWRGRRSRDEFRVLFEEFGYTTYLEAKAQGLL
jgi:hypothetical protein